MQCQYNSLQGIYKSYPKEFFPRTSLEGQTTWSKMVKIDQNRCGGSGITDASNLCGTLCYSSITVSIDGSPTLVFTSETRKVPSSVKPEQVQEVSF